MDTRTEVRDTKSRGFPEFTYGSRGEVRGDVDFVYINLSSGMNIGRHNLTVTLRDLTTVLVFKLQNGANIQPFPGGEELKIPLY